MTQPVSLDRRSAGVLLHLTSLPSPHGVGDLGPAAREFVDFLSDARQSWWQMLPVGPLGFGGSPYQALSAFAGNPLLISLDGLVEDGLVSSLDVRAPSALSRGKVEWEAVGRFKRPRLEKAFRSFQREGGFDSREYHAFRDGARYWLDDFALYAALKEAHGMAGWTAWPAPLASGAPDALRRFRETHSDSVAYQLFLQFQFHRQWAALRTYAGAQGVGVMGDVPIFVSHDSADVWARPSIFDLDASGAPANVAGVPPDYFSADGQRWGNPLYKWDVMRADGYTWWLSRIEAELTRFDALRLDHFIGFRRFWEIPASAPSARAGCWREGPGEAFFEALIERFGYLPVVAEDLGEIGSDVEALRDQFDLPGMKVLQFAFTGDPLNPFLPHNFTRRCVVYTGTHDNDTTVGWFRGSPQPFAKRYMGATGRNIHWDMIRLAHLSVATTAIVPAQDLLGLGTRARMNTPGRAAGNWAWRLDRGALDANLAGRLADLTMAAGRAPAGVGV